MTRPSGTGQHASGDELLVAGACSDPDIVARLGSDELVLLLCHTSTDHAADIGGRGLATLAQPMTIAGQPVTISGSVGAAT